MKGRHVRTRKGAYATKPPQDKQFRKQKRGTRKKVNQGTNGPHARRRNPCMIEAMESENLNVCLGGGAAPKRSLIENSRGTKEVILKEGLCVRVLR